MKRFRIIMLLLSVLLMGVVLTGCACHPSNCNWGLRYYDKETDFIGGVQREITYSDSSLMHPFAIASNDLTNISFTDDNTVEFSTHDGEKLQGSFTHKDVDNEYTEFTITFDNGEIAEGRCAQFLYGSPYCVLTFRDVKYYFEEGLQSFVDESYVIQRLRSKRIEPLVYAEVVKEDEEYLVKYTDGEYVITSETAVSAHHLDGDDNLTSISEVREGECLCIFDERNDIVTLYYVDPQNPKVVMLSEIVEWIGIFTEDDIVKMEIDEYYDDHSHEERIYTQKEDIEPILSQLRAVVLTEVFEDVDLSESLGGAVRIIVTTMNGEQYAIGMEDGYAFLDRKNWAVSDFPHIVADKEDDNSAEGT